MFSRSLQRSYSILAPIYDFIVSTPTNAARQRSLSQLGTDLQDLNILLSGIGSGLDIPYLPPKANYIGIDLTYNMLKRAQRRITTQNIDLQQGDVMQLPYSDEYFDVVIMHLILAVVPDSQMALDEAKRVLKVGGKILIYDKFLKPGQRAPIRRLLSPIMGKFSTNTNVVFENLNQSNLSLRNDTAGGWFREIVLQKH